MAGALRRPGLILALPALVGVATLLLWLAGRRIGGLWIMPDEAIYADRALGLWRHGHVPSLHGQGAGYSFLYPILAGFPFVTGSLARGYASLKLLQALTISLAAVPVVVYGRRLMPPRWALVAGGLTLVSPLLLYSGLVMSEVLFYPLAAFALLAIARAVETAAPRDQLVAVVAIALTVLTRVQGIVFVAVAAMALVLDAALAREPRRLRRFLPLWGVLVAGAAVALAKPGVFGAYAQVLRGSYPVHRALQLTLDHAAWTVLSTGVIPVCACALLLVETARGRERDPAARAVVAVTVCAVVAVDFQMGFFAARYAPHLLGRDLASLPPVLALVFCLWLARGAPRPRVATAAIAILAVALLVSVSWKDLVVAEALPDTFGAAILFRLRHHDLATIVTTVAAVGALLFALVPARLRLVLPALVGGVLLAATVVASDQISDQVRYDQVNLVGAPHRTWIDDAARGPVTYLYDGERYWQGVWQERFWNQKVRQVVSLAPFRVPGYLAQTVARIGPDGRLPLRTRYVVATDPHTFVGTKVAHLAQQTLEVTGLTLWRLDGPPRLATTVTGILPNGDMVEPGKITAYDCAGGSLQMTLLPKATQVVTVRLDGHVVLRQAIGGLPYWNGTVNVPPSPTPRVCRFRIDGQSLLGSTRIAFVPRGSS